MKMEFKLLLTLLFAIFFVGCKSYEEVNNLKLYDFEDYINKEIKVYEIKEWLYPILDSVIMKTEEVLACQKFENEITFSFEIDFNGSMNSVDLVISVEDSLDSFNHALWADAVFYYKEYKFYCGRTFLDSFFKKADKSISLTCVNPKKYRWDIPRRSEHKLEWFYCIEMRDD